ncbi:MAG: type II toxin-antitoxin system VapC family toxin [Betaproteobacteria bacterium]
MIRFLVDTGAWYAFADREDPDHHAVAQCLEDRSGRLITSNFIFDESVTLIRHRLGFAAARGFGESLLASSPARLLAITRGDEARAWEIFLRYRDKSFSYTDCTSFVLMRRLGVDTAVTLDRDFRSFGFTCLP